MTKFYVLLVSALISLSATAKAEEAKEAVVSDEVKAACAKAGAEGSDEFKACVAEHAAKAAEGEKAAE